MIKRLATGISALDNVLAGGVPAGATILVAGRPGSGKTILAHQMMFANTGADAKVIYLTTLGEPQFKIMKFQQEFEFFDYSKIESSVFYRDLGNDLRKKGPKSALTLIDNLLKEYEPTLIIIDTIKSVADMTGSMVEYREFILDLTVKLSTWGCTTVLLGEYSEENLEVRPESAIADGIILLSGNEERSKQNRCLRINKMRGTDYLSGEHFFQITSRGIEMFARLKPDLDTQVYNASLERKSSGIAVLDEMVGGGIPMGTTTLISGESGSGKTIIAVHSAYASLVLGEPVLYITFEENPRQLVNNSLSLGIDLQPYLDSGQLCIYHVAPIEVRIDEYVNHVQTTAREMGVKRIIIDSISSFEIGMADKVKYTDHIWSLCDYFKTQGINVFLTHEYRPDQLSKFTKHGISYIADNMLLLQNILKDSQLKHFIRVVKVRGSQHSDESREITYGDSGVSFN